MRTQKSSYRNEDVKEASILKLPRPENINPVITPVSFLLELLKQKKKDWISTYTVHSKKNQHKVTDIMEPLSILWVMIQNSNSAKDPVAPVVHMKTVLGLQEKTVVVIAQCSNEITYKRRKMHS